MKQFLKHILVFGLIFFLLEKGSYLLLEYEKNKQVDKRLESLLEGNMTKDIVIFGSSIGAGNILAGEIEKTQQLNTYNLSYHGSDVVFHKFLLQSLLKYNKVPKKVILVVDNPFYFKKEALNFRNDVLKPLAQFNYINNQLIATKGQPYFSKFLYTGRLNKDMLSFKRNEKNTSNPLDNYGSQPLLDVNKHPKSISILENKYSKDIEDSSKVKAFKAIQFLCEKHKIELLCVFSPSFRTHNTAFIERFKTLVNKEEGRVFVFDTANQAYKNKLNYYDVAHLNINGAKIFTSELNAYISSLK